MDFFQLHILKQGGPQLLAPHALIAFLGVEAGWLSPNAFFRKGLKMELFGDGGDVGLLVFGNPCFYGFFDGSG